MVDKHHDELWPCLARDPESVLTQPYRRCGRPHAFEASGQRLELYRLDRYPSATRLREEGAGCREDQAAQARPRGVAVKAVWDPPAWLENGGWAGAGRCRRGRRRRRDQPQRDVRDSRAETAATPAVEVRSTSAPSRTE